jgi:hypothetical protein
MHSILIQKKRLKNDSYAHAWGKIRITFATNHHQSDRDERVYNINFFRSIQTIYREGAGKEDRGEGRGDRRKRRREEFDLIELDTHKISACAHSALTFKKIFTNPIFRIDISTL